jgi:hypothetical protein
MKFSCEHVGVLSASDVLQEKCDIEEIRDNIISST